MLSSLPHRRIKERWEMMAEIIISHHISLMRRYWGKAGKIPVSTGDRV